MAVMMAFQTALWMAQPWVARWAQAMAGQLDLRWVTMKAPVKAAKTAQSMAGPEDVQMAVIKGQTLAD